MSRGKESDLGAMHGLLTKYYNQRLASELEEDKDELAIGISPAELTAMNNFLKQNSITCAIEESEGMSELQERLANKRKQGKAKLASVSSITGTDD
jgi:hypothetical protein